MESDFSTHQDKATWQDSQVPVQHKTSSNLAMSLGGSRPSQLVLQPLLQPAGLPAPIEKLACKLLGKLLQKVTNPDLQQRLQIALLGGLQSAAESPSLSQCLHLAVRNQSLDTIMENLQTLAVELDAEVEHLLTNQPLDKPQEIQMQQWRQTYSRINNTRRLLTQIVYPSSMNSYAQYTFAQDIMPSYLRHLTDHLQQTQQVQLQLFEETTKIIADIPTRALTFTLSSATAAPREQESTTNVTPTQGYLSILSPESQINSRSLNILAHKLYQGDLAKIAQLNYCHQQEADIFVGFSPDNQEIDNISELIPNLTATNTNATLQLASLLSNSDANIIATTNHQADHTLKATMDL